MNSFKARTQLFAGASTAIIATAMISVSAQAQSIVTDATLDSVLLAQITAGDATAQTNSESVTALNTNFDATTTSDGVITDSVLENNANVADATAMANRNGVSASLATIGSFAVAPIFDTDGVTILTPGSSSDGIALSGVSVNAGSVDATNSGADIGILATNFDTGSVDVSRNTTSANVLVNDGSGNFAMAINGSEPVGYNSLATTNAIVTTDLTATGAANIADLSGTLMVSSVQVAVEGVTGDSTATTTGALTSLELQTTTTADITGTATLDGNAITSTFTANSRTASIGLAADDGNTSATAAISTAQRFDANTSAPSATTDGVISAQIAGTGAGTPTTSFENSSLSVASNSLSATANGNTASTRIALADGLALDTVAPNAAGADIDEATGAVAVSGGLAGVNTQLTESGILAANLSGTVDVDVASPESSAIDVVSNRLIASANGNNLTAAITSGNNSAVFDASAVLASRQQLDDVVVSATSSGSGIAVDVGAIGAAATFADSTVTVDGNVLAASATGNRARQSITLEATALNASDDGSSDLSVNLVPGVGVQSVSADGSAIIASAMVNTDAQVSASNFGSTIAVTISDTDTVSPAGNTAVAVNSNLQQASAVGSDAGNSLSLTGVAVGSGAGIANLQSNDVTSTVTATQTASIAVDYTSDLTSGSGEILGNNQSAIARGVVASNNLVVDAQTVALGSSGTATTATATTADADAAFGVVNVQAVLADVTASTTRTAVNAFGMDVTGDLTDATTTVNSNTAMAQAQGAVAANGLTLEVGSLTSGNSSGDAAIANLQTIGNEDIIATANGGGNAVIETDIGGAVLDSSVETSGNRIMASAEAARATNVLTVSGTSLSGTGLVAGTDTSATSNNVDAQFGVANTQFAGTGDVTASLRDASGGAFENSSAIVTNLNGAVTSSAVESNGNLLQALASSNRATNAINVDGTTLTQTTVGLGNTQVSSQDVSATIGFAGTPGTTTTSADPATTSTFGGATAFVTGGTFNNLANTFTHPSGATFTLSGGATLTPNQAAYLTSVGFTATAGATNFTLSTTAIADVSAFAGFNLSGDGQATFTSFTIPSGFTSTTTTTGSVPAAGGVIANVGGSITSSTVAVDGNAVQGSAIGNVANNSVNVASVSADGVTILGSGDITSGATADADTVLASSQTLSAGSSSTTDVFTTFGVQSAVGAGITDSNLSVSDNSAFGEAIGNNVNNSLTVAGTDLASGTATSGVLTNAQDGLSANISADSEMQVLSNVVSSGSNVTLDRNVNNAQGVVNNANNTLVASSTNSAPSAQAVVQLPDGGSITTTTGAGSFSLVNGQQASGPLTTSATTNVSNTDLAAAGTTGVSDGSVSMSNNATRAESTANRAANIVAVGAEANLGSTAALLNQQSSSAVTTANAESNIGFGVSGSGTASLNASSVSIEGNSTLALARGNSAANTLSYTAGARYTGQDGIATIDSAAGLTQASAAMLNSQSNTGAIAANATGSTFVVLNDNSASAGPLNASVSNSNNSTVAFAVGNTATNTVMLSALTTGMPNIALGNQQNNSGPVTATATAVSYTMGSTGTVGASSFQNSGNAASATAIGNSSVSVIGAN